jgi:hypothetical protein
MKDAMVETSTKTETIYDGLEWKSSGKNGLRSQSNTTHSTYVVEPGGGGLWCSRHGFPTAPGRPNVLIGQYADKDVALVAAERHDYKYWKSSADRAGQKCAFLGSKGAVSEFVAAIPAHDRDDATEMLISDYTLEDGRPFSAAASFFAAQKSGLKQERNGKFTLTLAVDPETAPMWLTQTSPGAELVIGAVESGNTETNEWLERGKGAIKRSAMLPSDNSFQGWILQRYDRWGLVRVAMNKTTDDVEESVAETLRRIIGCPTRRELATNRDAISRIEKIDREFYLDMSRGFSG